MELWQCRRCGTWVAVDPTITDILKMRTMLCEECFVIEARETYKELIELNKKSLKVLKVRNYENKIERYNNYNSK